MKDLVRQRARELGFDACRFTTAQPPESAMQFQQWLTSGAHGEMGYLQRNADRRVDPQRVLPGAQAIITLAVSYGDVPSAAKSTFADGSQDKENELRAPPASATANSHSTTACHRGVVARYARFRDYHAVLGERLGRLTEFLNLLGGEGTRSLWYVDTGPVLERDLAQRSGLGFIGKHTNLISRDFGNWILLCEILTTLPFEPDPPERNRCGSCTRCLSACPTHAITAPFQLDARRCISYLTIELKGSIPLELRPAIGDRIFGCDDCLAVCPWNRFARQGALMKAHAAPLSAQPDLLELLSLDEPGFKSRFEGTPMIRTKRRGLLRNVAVALGNVGDQSALPALEQAAIDAEPLIAEHARWAIGQIQLRCNQTHAVAASRP